MCRSIELLGTQSSFLWGNASVWLVRRWNAFRPGGEGRRLFNWEESGVCRQGQRFRTASELPGVKHWAAPTDYSLWWLHSCFPHVQEPNLQFHCSFGDKHTESGVIHPAGKIFVPLRWGALHKSCKMLGTGKGSNSQPASKEKTPAATAMPSWGAALSDGEK